MNENDIISEIQNRFGEWVEMAGEQSPDLMINILCKMVIQEREKNEYYERCLYGVLNSKH